MLSQMLHRVNSGTLVGPAIFLTKLFEQLPQILEHGVFFVRARPIATKSSWHRSNACPFTAAVPSLSLIEASNRSLYP